MGQRQAEEEGPLGNRGLSIEGESKGVPLGHAGWNI